ncbi:MAG: GtrA family protein [Gammaproteobacteria bacterium]|jgi:putative flippase GtrA|nr:GtrA family protein [Gammaproteobacteria bacterium]
MVVGTTATVVYFVLLLAMVEWLGVRVIIATAIAYVVVTIENYFLHHLWTFNSEQSHGVAFPKYVTSIIAGFFINWSIMYIGVEVFAKNYLIVQAVAVITIIFLNLIAGSRWIFNKPMDAGGSV